MTSGSSVSLSGRSILSDVTREGEAESRTPTLTQIGTGDRWAAISVMILHATNDRYLNGKFVVVFVASYV